MPHEIAAHSCGSFEACAAHRARVKCAHSARASRRGCRLPELAPTHTRRRRSVRLGSFSRRLITAHLARCRCSSCLRPPRAFALSVFDSRQGRGRHYGCGSGRKARNNEKCAAEPSKPTIVEHFCTRARPARSLGEKARNVETRTRQPRTGSKCGTN